MEVGNKKVRNLLVIILSMVEILWKVAELRSDSSMSQK